MKLLITLLAIAGLAQNASAVEKLSVGDQKIVDVLLTANTIDITTGKMAADKSINPDVKTFAKEMVVDHSNAKKDVMKLGFKTHSTPTKSEISTALKEQAKANTKRLNKLTNIDFDKAYAEIERNTHQKVLDTIDTELLPTASNEELKTLLKNTRAVVASHLEHSKMLSDKLAKQ